MVEISKLLKNFRNRETGSHNSPVRNQEKTSYSIKSLMAPGNIEKLVREGRSPFRIGSVEKGIVPVDTEKKDRTLPYYQVPPEGFDPKNWKIGQEMEVYTFTDSLGNEHIGPTYILTDELAQQVEERKRAENIRLGRKHTMTNKEFEETNPTPG